MTLKNLVFGNHGLGRYILGTPSQVMNFSTEQIKKLCKTEPIHQTQL